jgi:hypothetical protein
MMFTASANIDGHDTEFLQHLFQMIRRVSNFSYMFSLLYSSTSHPLNICE